MKDSIVKQKGTTTAGWDQAVKLCQKYSVNASKADVLLNHLPISISSEERRRCQFLFLGVVRQKRFIDETLSVFVKKKPRPELWACLQVGVCEMMTMPLAERAKVVDFCVRRVKAKLSQRESGLVNAVLRKVAQALESDDSSEKTLGSLYSYPDWLIEKWEAQWGREQTLALLRWNQQPADVFIRWLGEGKPSEANFEPTEWKTFYRYVGESWASVQPHLDRGEAYVQDPSTRWAFELLKVEPGDAVLDLCAAPGGKSVAFLQALGQDSEGLLVAVDRPGKRCQQLDENLKKFNDEAGPEVHLVQRDLLTIPVEDIGLFDKVLLDAPCSNTGVIRRRPDVKWRLQPESISEMAELQARLLAKASEFVVPGGSLVYSTCSIESAENLEVVEAFIETHPYFKLSKKKVSLPWESNHDGAGAFLLKREAEEG